MREAFVAIAQFHPRLDEPQANLDRMGEIIDHICAAQKVNLIVFPELATTGYECGVRFTELAEQVPGYAIETLGARAQRYETNLAFGMVVKHKVESVVYDAAILLGPDGTFEAVGTVFRLTGPEADLEPLVDEAPDTPDAADGPGAISPLIPECRTTKRRMS